jgi:hypothetical protein
MAILMGRIVDDTTAEVAWIRTRSKLRTLLRAVGIGLVLLAAFNLYGATVTTHTPFAPYRSVFVSTLQLAEPFGVYVADLLVLGIGLVVAWFV